MSDRLAAEAAAAAAAARFSRRGSFSDNVTAPVCADMDRQLLVSFMLHSADLCTPLLPPALSQRVSNGLSREFAAQAALERASELPITVMLADGDAAKAKMEIAFLDFVVKPLYAKLVEAVPSLRPCLALIDANRDAWASLQEAATIAHGLPMTAAAA
jgi:hypothetical protein